MRNFMSFFFCLRVVVSPLFFLPSLFSPLPPPLIFAFYISPIYPLPIPRHPSSIVDTIQQKASPTIYSIRTTETTTSLVNSTTQGRPLHSFVNALRFSPHLVVAQLKFHNTFCLSAYRSLSDNQHRFMSPNIRGRHTPPVDRPSSCEGFLAFASSSFASSPGTYHAKLVSSILYLNLLTCSQAHFGEAGSKASDDDTIRIDLCEWNTVRRRQGDHKELGFVLTKRAREVDIVRRSKSWSLRNRITQKIKRSRGHPIADEEEAIVITANSREECDEWITAITISLDFITSTKLLPSISSISFLSLSTFDHELQLQPQPEIKLTPPTPTPTTTIFVDPSTSTSNSFRPQSPRAPPPPRPPISPKRIRSAPLATPPTTISLASRDEKVGPDPVAVGNPSIGDDPFEKMIVAKGDTKKVSANRESRESILRGDVAKEYISHLNQHQSLRHADSTKSSKISSAKSGKTEPAIRLDRESELEWKQVCDRMASGAAFSALQSDTIRSSGTSISMIKLPAGIGMSRWKFRT